MAKQNTAFLYASVHESPRIAIDRETGELKFGIAYVRVVRGLRDAHDGINFRYDIPIIMSKEPEILAEMKEWSPNDIVFIKGTLACKDVPKKSYCPHCTDDQGNSTMNMSKGSLVYINPIYVKKVKSCEDENKATEDLKENREISNQIYCIGTLLTEPKLFKTKNGTSITQYKIAINRKYRIRTDSPETKTDWPWVKSFGEQAIEDKLRLKQGSDVYIDGFIQARQILRTTKCEHCGEFYRWEDTAMEIVPFAVEYGRGTYKSDEELEEAKQMRIEEIKQSLHDDLFEKDELDEETHTVEVDEQSARQGGEEAEDS